MAHRAEEVTLKLIEPVEPFGAAAFNGYATKLDGRWLERKLEQPVASAGSERHLLARGPVADPIDATSR